MGNLLEITGLTKTYPGFSLSNVSFTLPEDCIAGLTNKLAEVKSRMPDILIEKPSIEDIMLGYVDGGRR